MLRLRGEVWTEIETRESIVETLRRVTLVRKNFPRDG